MKKIFVAIILLFILSNIIVDNRFSLNDYFEGEYTSYFSDYTQNCVDLGFCYAGDVCVGELIGESVEVIDLEVGAAIKLLNAKVVRTEYINNVTVIYAQTNLIHKNVLVGGEKVNLQFAIKEDSCIIGWPLILGGF